MKRLCRTQSLVPFEQAQGQHVYVAVECERKRHHGGKRHKASWRQGEGGRFWDIVVKW